MDGMEEAEGLLVIAATNRLDMIDEAFYDNKYGFEAMSQFIALCANNYGGKTYTLQDEVNFLEAELANALIKIEKQKEEFSAEIKRVKNIVDDETRLEMYKLRTDFSVSSQRLNALCQWAKDNDNSDFLSERVLIDGYYRYLCD